MGNQVSSSRRQLFASEMDHPPVGRERGRHGGGRGEVFFFSSIGRQSQSPGLFTSGEHFPETGFFCVLAGYLQQECDQALSTRADGRGWVFEE